MPANKESPSVRRRRRLCSARGAYRVVVLLFLIGLGRLLAGCKVGPNYQPPSQPMPEAWKSPPTTQASITVQKPVETARWWTTFNDPTLDSLIKRATASNLTLEVSTQRIREARATVGIVKKSKATITSRWL